MSERCPLCGGSEELGHRRHCPSLRKPRYPINYRAWAENMIAYIRSRGLEDSFKDWSGGWPYPVPDAGMIRMPVADVNNLDEVVAELGIADSETTPAEAVKALKAEIVRLHESIAAHIKVLEKIASLRDAEDANEPFDEALDIADAALRIER